MSHAVAAALALGVGAVLGLLAAAVLLLIVAAAVGLWATVRGELEPADEDGGGLPYVALVDAHTTQPEYDALFQARTGIPVHKQYGNGHMRRPR